IGIRGGLASWRGETLKQYPQLADISFFSLLEDREGTVWAVGEVLGSSSPQSRLCALHDGQVQCYGEGGPFRQWVEAVYEDREGNLWVGGADGLWRWRPGAPQHYVSSPIARITEDENGTLVLSGREGLRKFVGGKIEPYALPGAKSEIPVRLLRSSDGN